MKRILTVALAGSLLVGLGACSSDSSSSNKVTLPAGVTLPDGVTIPDVTLPPDLTIPSDLSLPGNLTDECKAIAIEFASLTSQLFAPTGQEIDVDSVFGNLDGKVPEELTDDLQVIAAAFGEYAAVLKANNNDYTNPDVQAAIQALSTPEFETASNNVQAYFDATCPQN